MGRSKSEPSDRRRSQRIKDRKVANETISNIQDQETDIETILRDNPASLAVDNPPEDVSSDKEGPGDVDSDKEGPGDVDSDEEVPEDVDSDIEGPGDVDSDEEGPEDVDSDEEGPEDVSLSTSRLVSLETRRMEQNHMKQ